MAHEAPKQPPRTAKNRHRHGAKPDTVREQAIVALLESRTIAEARSGAA